MANDFVTPAHSDTSLVYEGKAIVSAIIEARMLWQIQLVIPTTKLCVSRPKKRWVRNRMSMFNGNRE